MLNRKAIVLGISPNYAYAAARVLQGLNEYMARDDYDVIILHNGVTDSDQRALRAIKDCAFERYEFSALSRPEDFKDFSIMAFSRYQCFDLLREYEYVAWLDVDILICGDLSDFFELCRNGMAIYVNRGQLRSTFDFKEDVADFDRMALPRCYSGTFVVHRTLNRWQEMTPWCYKKTLQYQDKITGDQAIFSLLLKSFDIRPSYLGVEYVYRPDRDADRVGRSDVKIEHYYGYRNTWGGTFDKRIDAHYQQWLALGGSPSADYQRFRRRYLGWRSYPVCREVYQWQKKLKYGLKTAKTRLGF